MIIPTKLVKVASKCFLNTIYVDRKLNNLKHKSSNSWTFCIKAQFCTVCIFPMNNIRDNLCDIILKSL